MKLKSLKSQITTLMIFGLVLFIAVSLVIYISKLSVKKSSQNIKKMQETGMDTQPIKEFVAKCLDKLSKDSLVLIGKQGGYIYTSQGGTLVDYQNTDEGKFFVKNGDFKAAYDIKMPSYTIFPYTSDVPDYPWAVFPYNNNLNAESFEGIFGIDDMPPLTPSGGSHSIQAQIEEFVDNNMQKCADFSFFKKQGFDIFMNSSKTTAIIGSSDIIIKSIIPIKIKNQATNEFAEISDFSTNINTRLRDIYYFIKELIEDDIKNIKFNIGDDKNNRDFLNIRVAKDAYSADDLIIVTDEKSLIYGKPFEYAFARKNRAPALYFIRKTTSLEFEQNHLITQEDLLQGSELKAEDPDEDSRQFKFMALSSNPNLPTKLDRPQITFRIEVSDGKLSDYQDITVKRIP